ncbi:F-box domain [Arabidopsis suecica]|uniref:F-box domain n=1 Tax=Arabidopsis suecica TaxID=45249 RepID=A0A8T2BXP7_ARASU|nr:F-box domain [Arabidopsis suecica]
MERLSSSSVPVENVDWISKLPNDLLLMILSRLSTDEAVRTSVVSKRWEHVWKHMSHLVLDMRKKIASSKYTPEVSKRVATLMTKIINNHRGHLESCVIDHYTNGMLNTWIQSLTGARQTKHLTLRHHLKLTNRGESIDFPPNSFSYLGLISLSLSTYIFRTSHSFNNCKILKTLKLSCMIAPNVGVFNRVLTSCASLECHHLVCIFSPSMKFSSLQEITLSSRPLDSSLVVYKRTCLPHISYNISQEENCIGHEEFVVNTCGELLRVRLPASLSVSVDSMNRREVERLREVLLLWSFTMAKLEIFFKNNAPREEGESSPNENNKKDSFHNAKFRVDSVWMHNFSGSEEEFALVSCLIRQRMVVKKMMIKTTSFPARKKLEIETAVAKLQALQTQDQWELTINCF